MQVALYQSLEGLDREKKRGQIFPSEKDSCLTVEFRH